MASKIEIIGNAILVTDTVTLEEIFESPVKDVYYDSKILFSNQLIVITKLNPFTNKYSQVLSIPLSEAVNSSLVSFTAVSFKALARTSLGFNTASGGSGAASPTGVQAIGNTIYNGVSSYTVKPLSSATNTITWTGAESNLYSITLSKDSVLSNPTSPIAGTVYQFLITQNSTGLWSLTYGNMFKFPDGAAPVIDANPNSKGILTALYDGSSLLVVSIQNFL
jgi:hypothetical protein